MPGNYCDDSFVQGAASQMVEQHSKRRLAAILVADVVGYSSLMERDEAGTIAALRHRRVAILEPVVARHEGRIVKFMGDAVLVEFASAVNAVAAAAELQQQMEQANENLDQTNHIVLRLGINLGDIVGEGRDVYGDGVNVAARLEALAQPGDIYVSAKVRDEVDGRLPLQFEDLGDQQLKNIERPVRVFRVVQGVTAAGRPPRVAMPDKPAVAVLPFSNMSGEAEQQYFSDGITEDIITELSRSRFLSVVARNSSFQFRDKPLDVRRIAGELGARYVVEGSVRKMGSRVRITAQLIDAATGNHLWSERFDRGLDELFDVQDELVRTIVATVAGRLEDAEINVAARKRTDSPQAYDSLLKGIRHLRGYDPGDNRAARELFEQAIALDPRYALAHAYLALALLVENNYTHAPEHIRDRAIRHAIEAVRLDPRDSRCHTFLGQVYRLRDNYDLALMHLERGVELNPNDATSLVQLALVLSVCGRPEEGMERARDALKVDPYIGFAWATIGLSLYLMGRYDEALAAYRNLGANMTPWQMAREAACLAQLDRIEEANAIAAEVLRRKPQFSIRIEMPHYKFPADSERMRQGLRKAGLPD